MISLNKHSINATVHDRYATINYLFEFKNDNPKGSNELKFEITISQKAFISQFKANIDGEIFIGTTKEKNQALKKYAKAKENNQNTILIQQTDSDISNLFTISTNIDSGSQISLTITIEQYVTKKFNFNTFDIQILRHFHQYSIVQNYDFIAVKFDVNDKSGIYNIMINNNIPSKLENCSSLIIDDQRMDKLEHKYVMNGKIMIQSTILNEITLQYKIKGEQNAIVLFDRKSSTFCHIISNIFNNNEFETLQELKEGQNKPAAPDIFIPRRVVFVLDCSSSMRGNKWNKTMNATITALKQLRYGYDRYCIVLFSDSIHTIPFDTLVLCNETNINENISFLQNNIADGGTNINDSLLKGIHLIQNDVLTCNDNSNDNIYMNQILFITDGAATVGEQDSKKIIQNIKDVNYSEKISIFSFGVGSDNNTAEWTKDLNHSFLKTLSTNNYGFYKRIKQSNTTNTLNEYFKLLSKPVLCDINIRYDNKNVCDLTATNFNALYAGNDLIICGKLNIHNEQKECELYATINAVTCTGKARKPVHISKKIKTNVTTIDDNNTVEKIWAYTTLQELASKKLMTNDMIEMDENERKQQHNTALKLAMKYKFITPWTSMIVVKENEQSKANNIDIKQNKNENVSDKNFIAKTTEIERRIIQHLHQRGYTDTHPDYNRYIAKAKELAIQKAGRYRNRQIQNKLAFKPKRNTTTLNTFKCLIILRGLPGSGKSTLAKKIASQKKNSIICSEDKYHWSGQLEGVGQYKFDASLVFSAREWCNNEIIQSINNSIELVVIDNHNSRVAMYEKHIQYAIQNGYRFRIIEFVSDVSLIDQYKSRSYKPFPKSIYIKLLESFEKDPRAEIINPVFVVQKHVVKTVLNTFPMKYEVRIQARVRREKELMSAYVTDLPEGSIITVIQMVGMRARISYPVCGWLSVKTKYNQWIIIPTHKQYEKIGKRIMFKNYGSKAIIIDYDEITNMHKIQYMNGSMQWVDLRRNNNNIVVLKKNNKSNNLLRSDAPMFSLRKTETFFNQFFCRDYPQYQALSNSTKEKMKIGGK